MQEGDTHNPTGPIQTAIAPVDVREHGAVRNGKGQVLDSRLFMQLLVVRCPESESVERMGRHLQTCLEAQALEAVLYADLHDPRSFGLLTWSEDPEHLITQVRPLFDRDELRTCVLRTDYTMVGRTYSSGYEPDLAFWLLERARQTVLNEAWPWAIWYPLRRTGSFAQLDTREQGRILREHSVIGRSYGIRDLAHDVRLACHGLDATDNEFVIGLVGKELHPLSHVVQTMRRTRQTSEYIERMGPFFVGRVVWRKANVASQKEAK